MTLEDLEQTRLDAYWAEYDRWPGTDPTGKHIKANRAGIRAVVEALRDELRREWFLDDSGLEAVERWMNEILASDGKEAAGGSTSDASAPICGDTAPAAAPVCEWTPISTLDGVLHYSTPHGVRSGLNLYRRDDVCPFCLKPISFKEASE